MRAGKEGLSYMSREEKRRRGAKSIFWGVLLLLGAAAIVVSKLGYLEDVGIWSILFSVFLLGFLVDGFLKRSFGEILFSVAFLIIVNDKLLELEDITPWPVLGAALLGTIGLNLLFPRFRKKNRHVTVQIGGADYDGRTLVSEEIWEGDCVSYENAFGEAVKYLSGEIAYVKAENSFGSLQIYFTDAQLKGGSATIHVENSFGSTVLYVPASWKIVLNTENAFGGSKEQGHCNPEGNTVLYVKGEVSFGSLKIRYV